MYLKEVNPSPTISKQFTKYVHYSLTAIYFFQRGGVDSNYLLVISLQGLPNDVSVKGIWTHVLSR